MSKKQLMINKLNDEFTIKYVSNITQGYVAHQILANRVINNYELNLLVQILQTAHTRQRKVDATNNWYYSNTVVYIKPGESMEIEICSNISSTAPTSLDDFL